VRVCVGGGETVIAFARSSRIYPCKVLSEFSSCSTVNSIGVSVTTAACSLSYHGRLLTQEAQQLPEQHLHWAMTVPGLILASHELQSGVHVERQQQQQVWFSLLARDCDNAAYTAVP
jgi:hypothetical protein